MDSHCTRSLPFWMVLILVICLFSLAVHFLTEQAGISPTVTGISEIDGHSEDHFIPTFLTFVLVIGLLVRTVPQFSILKQSLSLSPILLPPNL